nr:MAG TPA: hypothetical protein [Caudoviricetes sp.]
MAHRSQRFHRWSPKKKSPAIHRGRQGFIVF